MINILAVILIVSTAQVLSETSVDVIESFAQIFEKLHQDISEIQSVAHSSAYEINRHFTVIVYKADNLLTQNQNNAKAVLNKQKEEILDRLNLSPNNADVKKCIADSDVDVDKMILRSQGGLQVCKTTDAERINKATALLNELYSKQSNEHRDLEATKLQCNSTAKDAAQLRNCLYYQLFVVHIDLIKELKEDSQHVLKNYESVSVNVGNKLLQCSNVVKRNILEEVDQIVLKFNNCCYNILGVKQSS